MRIKIYEVQMLKNVFAPMIVSTTFKHRFPWGNHFTLLILVYSLFSVLAFFRYFNNKKKQKSNNIRIFNINNVSTALDKSCPWPVTAVISSIYWVCKGDLKLFFFKYILLIFNWVLCKINFRIRFQRGNLLYWSCSLFLDK